MSDNGAFDPEVLSAFFAPTNRRPCLVSQHITQVEFTGDDLGDILKVPGLTLELFQEFLSRQIVWVGWSYMMARQPFLDHNGGAPFIISHSSQSSSQHPFVIWGAEYNPDTVACFDVLFGLLARSEEQLSITVSLTSSSDHAYPEERTTLPLSGTALGNFVAKASAEAIEPRELVLKNLTLTADHFMAMANAPVSPQFDIMLDKCRVTNDAAALAMRSCLGVNRGPNVMDKCEMHVQHLAAVLRTQRLYRLTPTLLQSNLDFATFTDALADNQSLRVLCINVSNMSNQYFDTSLCTSLYKHPLLQTLDLQGTFGGRLGESPRVRPAGKVSRTMALARLLRSNTVVREIVMDESEYDVPLFQELVQPRLEMNLSEFAAERRAIQASHFAVRPKLLGRALAAARHNPNLLYKFVSGNAEIVVAAVKARVCVPVQRRNGKRKLDH